MTTAAEWFDPVHKNFLVTQHRLWQAASKVDLTLIH